MASNIKWYKRAVRTLTAGETRLWEAIKKKLPADRVQSLEEKFLKKPKKQETSQDKTEERTVERVPKEKTAKKRPAGKTKTAKKGTRKKATKTKNKKEVQDG